MPQFVERLPRGRIGSQPELDRRAFVGRQSILRELREGTSRWASVGLVVDWRAYDELFTGAGLIPPKDERPLGYESMLYDEAGARKGPLVTEEVS